MGYTRSVVRGTIWVFVMAVLAGGAGYLFRLLLARGLSLEDFGLFFAVLAFVNLLYGIKTFGTGPAFVRYVAEYRAKNDLARIKTFFVTFLIIQLVLFGLCSLAILLLVQPLAAHYFKTSKAVWPLVILLGAFFFTNFITSFRQFFSAYRRMDYYASVEFFQAILILGFSAALLAAGVGYLAPVWAYVLAFALVSVLCLFLTLRIFPLFRVKTAFTREAFRELLVFGVPITLANIGTSLFGSLDVLLLTHFTSLQTVGLYSVALPTAGLLRYIPKAVAAVIFPYSADLYYTKNPRFPQGITMLYRYLIALMMPFTLILLVFTDEIISILFGAAFVGAAPALRVLAVAMLFSGVYLTNQSLYLGVSRPKEYALTILAGVALTGLFAVLLIPRFGLVGAALTTGISAVFLTSFSTLRLCKHIGSRVPFGAWFLTCVLGAGVGAAMLAAKNALALPGLIELIVVSAVGCGLYGSLALLFRLVRLDEFRSALPFKKQD